MNKTKKPKDVCEIILAKSNLFFLIAFNKLANLNFPFVRYFLDNSNYSYLSILLVSLIFVNS